MAPAQTVTLPELLESPAWFPLEVSQGAVQLLQLDEAAYRTASFLDQRLRTQGYREASCPLELVRRAGSSLPPRAYYVFHTGHVGSTLISRLLGAHESFFSLREPALLRTLAAGAEPGAAPGSASTLDLRSALGLFSRSWRCHQRPLIKLTSIVSELTEVILGADEHPKAILMFTDPATYLRGILAGPNSRIETRMQAPARRRRLLRRLAGEWWSEPRSEGEQIAMTWLCEMLALHQGATRFADRVAWVHFDAFLQDPASALRTLFHALGAELPCAEIQAIVAGPLMRQYSKAPEHAYDAALRRAVLLSADREHPVELRRGMQWLQAAGGRSPLVAAVLAFAADPAVGRR